MGLLVQTLTQHSQAVLHETTIDSDRVAETSSAERSSSAELGAGSSGLVICPKTVRNSLTCTNSDIPDDASGLFPTRFPDRETIDDALSWGSWCWDGREGPVPQLEVAPGLVRLTAPDLNRREKRRNRSIDAPVICSTLDASEAKQTDGLGEIRGWSRKSRANMLARLATLDYKPLMGRIEQPAMVTLTYPRQWEKLAPDGKTVKKHLIAFFKRYERAWGEPWCGVWKLEFQRRGAPHFHLLQIVPHGTAGDKRNKSSRGRRLLGEGLPFRSWLSLIWADIVGSTGDDRKNHELSGTAVDFAEGAKARNPKAAAAYFSKHGAYASKEYQNEVPELWIKNGSSVGRFWGYRGLSPLVRGITMSADDSIKCSRVLRSLGSRNTYWNGRTRKRDTVKALRKIRRPRRTILPDGTVKQKRDKSTGELVFSEDGTPVDHLSYRWQTVPVQRMKGTIFGGGYLCVESGPDIARELGRYLAICNESNACPPVGMRGSIRYRNHTLD